MSLPIWNRLCEQPPTLVATFTEKHAKLVHDSTIQLHRSLDSILSTLNRRAIALTKLANFESALRDAQLIQQLSPSSALSYICEAGIYREQGKQRHVVDVCSKGLDRVDTKDPDYTTLQDAKTTAEHLENTRIDFISQLPVDLVVTKLIPMFMDDSCLSASEPCPYLYVSNVWRDCIIQSLDGLRFRIDEEEEVQLSQVIEFAQHTKVLSISPYSHGTWLSDLLRQNDFYSLRDLNIEYFRNEDDTSFLSSLKSISSTLRSFFISISIDHGDHDVLPIADIVSACPNLVTLGMEKPFDADFSLLPMTACTSLTKLYITQSATKISLDHVEAVGKRFPSLKKLTLSPCTDLQPSLVVSQYWPSMQSLQCVISRQGVEMTCSGKGGGCEEQPHTITHLSLHSYEHDRFDHNHVSSLLQKYQGCVVHLEIDIIHDVNDEDGIYAIQYPMLKKLVLCQSGWWIPRNAPLLEELELYIDVIYIYPQVLDTIPPNLQKLVVSLQGYAIADTSAIVRYFHRLSVQSTLKDLSIDVGYHYIDVDAIVDAFCYSTKLERLQIYFDIDWDGLDMEGYLLKVVKGCPRLTRLDIHCKYALSTKTLDAFQHLEHLEELQFSIDGAQLYKGFWKAIESLTQLKQIRLYPDYPAFALDIKHLRQHRPDMHITTGKFFVPF